jgi:signal transduction histidine kinase
MNIPTISLIAMIASVASIAIALAMLFLVLWQAPKHRDNQLMALYMIEVIFWGIMAFMVRFWTTAGLDSSFFFAGIVMGIGFSGLFLCALVSHYAGLWKYWWLRALLLAGLLNNIINIPLIFQGNLYTDFHVSAEGSLLFHLLPLGFVSFGITYLFHFGSLAILWKFRNQRAGKALLAGGILLSAGVLTSLSAVLSQYSIAIMAAGVSTIFFTFAILRENLFNPLALLNEELTQANTRLSQITGKLQLTNQQLAEANRLKSQFLASMSHELRTPLNSIIGYTELLLQGIYGDLSEKQTDRLTKVMKNGQHLLQLINDILDLSKIEAGHMLLELEPVQLVPILEECLAVFEPLVAKKGLVMQREVQADLPQIMADKGRVLQVVTNLVSNAVKFTHEGHIILYSHVLDDGNRLNLPPDLPLLHEDWVLLGVKDTGIGITPEDQKIIFDEFRQVDGSTTREYEGTGLGLAITRKLVKMMNGHIWLESEPGKGTQFWVMVPKAKKTTVLMSEGAIEDIRSRSG